jgi:tetratricopeptide (TPR) repeat protein
VAALVVAVVVGIGALAATGVTGRAWDEFRTPASTTAPSDPAARLSNLNSLRYELWQAGGDAWREEPVHGIGPGTYELWWNRFATRPQTVRDAHSLYLENLAELGVGGLLAVLLLAGGLLAAAFRTRPRNGPSGELGLHAALCAAAVILFAHAGIDWLWESTAVGLLGVVCATLAAARASEPAARGPRTPWRIGLALAAAAVCLLQLPGIAGTLRERAGRDALEDGDRAAALRYADDAVEIQPWAATPLALRGEGHQSAGRLGAARDDLRRAIDAEPTNWRHWFLLARLEAQAGRSEAAVRALAESRRLNPLGEPFRR